MTIDLVCVDIGVHICIYFLCKLETLAKFRDHSDAEVV
jgi:hypothetical protein